MTVYFTYCIRNKTTNQHYYGARWKPGCHPSDLWNTYFTSSKKVHKLIQQYGSDDFEVEIRKTFETEHQCRSWEMKVLHKLKVQENDKWLNIALNTPTMLGRRHSPKTIAKMKAAKKSWDPLKRKKRSREYQELARKGILRIPRSSKPVIISGKEYPSAKHASNDYPNIHYTTLWRWCRQGKNSCSMKLCD